MYSFPQTLSKTPSLFWGRVGAVWGIVGFILLLSRGVFRLHTEVASLNTNEVSTWHLVAMLVSILLFGIGEGYFALQQAYIPRLLKRAEHLKNYPTTPKVLFAPLYCMGLIGWDRLTTLKSWGGVVGVLTIIFLVRLVPTPWIEIILVGVIAALSWGCIVSLIGGFRMFVSGTSQSDELSG